MKKNVVLPDLELSVGLGEAIAQTSVIHPVIIVVVGANPEIPFAVFVIIAGSTTEM